MDYGKLAYLKAVDIEDRIGLTKSGNFSVTVIELNDLPQGQTKMAQVTGKGDVAVFVNSSDEAEFYVDEDKVCEGGNVFFKINGSGTISAVGDGIQKLRLMIIGNAALRT